MFSKNYLKELYEKSSFLNESIGEQHCPFIPLWMQFLNKVIESTEIYSLQTRRSEQLFEQTNPIPFQEILSLFVFVGTEELFKKNSQIMNIFSKNSILDMQKYLLKSLAKISSEIFYIEFCANNIQYIKRFLAETDEFENDSNSNIQYKNFIEKMLHGGRLKDFFMEYAVLAKHLSQTVCRWVDFMTELTSILKKDYNEISHIFFEGSVQGKVLSMESGLSDNHNNNKTVVKLTFENQRSIIFKPRNIGVEKAYYKLLDFLNKRNCVLRQRILKIIDGETYGWIEYVEHLPCKTLEQVRNYYRRSGALLCIVYVFCGSDFHLENIVASGETPVLIDLEMLINNNQDLSNINSWLQIDDVLKKNNSVLYTGLLPVPYKMQDGKISDLSGLGGETDVETTLKESIWKNINTDSMYVEIKHIKNLSYKNVVKLNGKPIAPVNYVDEIAKGFEETYRIFIELKDEFLQEKSILHLFSHQLMRYVFRETKNYSQLIKNSLKPPFMRNGKDWSKELDRFFSALHVGLEPIHEILGYEYQAINKLDVPFISYWTDSKDLILGQNVRINNYFCKTSFDKLKDNIMSLNEEDIQKQIGAIKSSYNILNEMKNPASNVPDVSHIVSCSKNNLEQSFFVHEAEKIAKEILENRIESYGSVNWSQLIVSNTHTYMIKMMGSGLYSGNAGIAIFFSALSKIVSKTDYHGLARKTLKPIRDYLCGRSVLSLPKRINLGMASGLGGVIYSTVLAGKFLEDDTFNKEAVNIIPKISNEIIEQDNILDIIGGSSGMILSLLSLYNETKNEATLLTAIRCGKHLLKNRSKSQNGLRAWKHNMVLAVDEQPLCGFSHGASGIAYALLKLFKVTGIKEFLDAAEEAILYEDGLISGEMEQWPDLRKAYTGDENKKLYNAWCHGAAGILITRMEALCFLNKENMMTDINRALQIIINMPSSVDHVCCGTYGKIDVLLTASQRLSRPDLQEKALEMASFTYSEDNMRSRYNNLAKGYTNFGFFQGVSGIAYTMLRLSHKDAIPSVLSFDI
ncbi:type 2 lanthipeptide synthetase LanM family protein [Desulfosporosinus sp. FKB]|uniref:type 2 lanthipeptide synthetase LanM family protein n=1 Tax=Desulfosporosinus sp. FKB TaxID=1969835 RepID=UPI000B49E1FA|nr:type 2 lanthipeptide synthetase LanM family protein [Desulfosporosinus sp. FKB]